MTTNILPPVNHINPLTAIRRERRLSLPGTVTVRVNEKVQAADIVAEGRARPRHYFLDIARGLGINEDEVGKYLLKEQGVRIDAGEVIAGPVGIARRTIRAPSDGSIVGISGGRVLFEAISEPFPIRAGFPGIVVSTDGSTVVTIETTGALIQGKWGNGKQDWGVMRLIGEGPGQRLHTDKLDMIMRGSILIVGFCDHSTPLHQAAELSIKGLVVGSMSSDLIPVARRLPYPIVVIEGFGDIPINSVAFNLLSSNIGREATLDANIPDPHAGRYPEIIIPLPATREVDLPDQIVPLTPGVRVKVLRPPHQGVIGAVREILKGTSSQGSGVTARCASVDLDDIGPTLVPIENLEIVK